MGERGQAHARARFNDSKIKKGEVGCLTLYHKPDRMWSRAMVMNGVLQHGRRRYPDSACMSKIYASFIKIVGGAGQPAHLSVYRTMSAEIEYG